MAQTHADDPCESSLVEAARLLRAGAVSSVELTQSCLARIEALNPQLNAYITVVAQDALDQARQADLKFARAEDLGELQGIPIAFKDNIDTAGIMTTAACAAFADRVPVADAEVVGRLRARGAVVLGKLNMHELAMGTTSAISHYGPVRNPWDMERVAGGSSGGCATAVAAGMCFAAVGTDTGGSVRIPAACCGIVGLKPTFGVVSTAGTIRVSPSLDHVGPMCRTVQDTAVMLRAMTDHAVAARALDSEHRPDLAILRVGVLDSHLHAFGVTTDPQIHDAVSTAVDVIRSLTASVRQVSLPTPDLGRIALAEAYEIYARLAKRNSRLFDPRTRELIAEGSLIDQETLGEMRRALAQHRDAVRGAFAEVDVLVLPTIPVLPPRICDANTPFSLPYCTFAFNLGGLPSISVPCGFSREGLPIGLLISGAPLSEASVLALAQGYEAHTARVSAPAAIARRFFLRDGALHRTD
jgi:aspartyl-tRNA(Asn)/glutamyl-tRNA(Gln) amidotransferase subunit A